jgi:AraC-like DNA-binding protein
MAEFTDFWLHPRFSDLGMLRATFRDHKYNLHTHSTYVIALITDGCERARIGNKSVRATPGTIAIVNPEECHDGEAGAEGGWSYLTFYPTLSLMRSLYEELGQTGVPEFACPHVDDHELANSFYLAHTMSRDSEGLGAETALIDALQLLILRHSDSTALGRVPTFSGAGERVRLYEELVRENITAEFDLDFFAEAAGVSRFQVIRDFKKFSGLTPAAYVRNHKLRFAASKIAEGFSLAEAGLEAGFFDQSHFSRVFRAVNGMTPGTFQSAIRCRSVVVSS